MHNASLFQEEGTTILRVALPVPTDELFDYSLPPALSRPGADKVQIGCRVAVPFGARKLTGIVLERHERGPAPERYRLRPISELVDPEPVLSPSMLAVLREAAAAVLCPLGIALAAALPAGSSPKSVAAFELTPRGQQALAQNIVQGPALTALKLLAEGPVATRRLERSLSGGATLLRDCTRDGLIRKCLLELGPTAKEAQVRTAEVASGLDVETLAAGELKRAPKQAALLRALARIGKCSVPELKREFPSAPSLLRNLEKRGFVCMGAETARRDVLGTPLEDTAAPTLTSDQRAVLGPLRVAIEAGVPQTFLLHGVTGSGKTEIYLQAVGCALARGRQALLLVPEITLTHQVLARLRGRFGDNLAVLHSGLSQSERLEQWRRLREGSTPIAVGARSALFAPLENLGVIILDEEHDGAYKSEEGFRYHARNLAELRGKGARCPVVLGSATPSLETRFAADQGEIERIVLPKRIGDRPLPEVEIVDLAKERAKQADARALVLSLPLRRALRETLAGGDQTLLFLNRRGFSTKVFCYACGHAEHCQHCDIALVFHAHDQILRCHYCDFSMEPPRACSNCGTQDTALLGLGTQRLEEEVRLLFPDAQIARLDRDVSQRKGATEKILVALREREIDVLIGTQMIAKGHDFPGVRTVGVIAADLGLHMPDFRAAERSFQLLTQVAGRAGRGDTPGRVILQTFSPEHYAIRPVATHDYESFYAEELEHRRDLGYPPFGGLVHLVLAGPDLLKTENCIHELIRQLRKKLPAEASPFAAEAAFEILGPAPCPLPRLRNQFRFQVLLKGSEPTGLRSAATFLDEATRKLPASIHSKLDLNPLNML